MLLSVLYLWSMLCLQALKCYPIGMMLYRFIDNKYSYYYSRVYMLVCWLTHTLNRIYFFHAVKSAAKLLNVNSHSLENQRKQQASATVLTVCTVNVGWVHKLNYSHTMSTNLAQQTLSMWTVLLRSRQAPSTTKLGEKQQTCLLYTQLETTPQRTT